VRRGRSEEQQCRLLRLAERASARDRAIVVVLLYTGLRLAELVALDRSLSSSVRRLALEISERRCPPLAC
jgi:site-specific recombinase XerC